MTDIIFAKTRWTYDSYVDFWRLAELSGYPIIFLDEMDIYNPNHTYITAPTNGEILEIMNEERRESHTATIVQWNLERPGGSGTLEGYIRDNRRLIAGGWFDKVIVSDRRLAQDTGFHYVPVGSHEGLGSPGAFNSKKYDGAHLMCYSNRRAEWFQDPTESKLKVRELEIAPRCWGDCRHKILQESRFMFNVHQDQYLYMEPLRFALAAAYGLPIITETLHDGFPYESFEAVQMSNPIDFHYSPEEYKRYYDIGLSLREGMTQEYTFRNCLEYYL